MSTCKKHKIHDVNYYKNEEPDTNCTCDVGVTGPAGDPELLAKKTESILHPETPAATGPGK